MTDQALPLFYKQVAPLNKDKHSSWRIQPPTGYSFAAGTNSIYIAAVEFARAAHGYPIVFGKGADNSVFPVVLLGLKNSENLYVNKKGEWQADYIPAYVRRYPFILATAEKDGETSFTVCIDEGYSGFSESGKKGQPLFADDGEQSPLLDSSIRFLKEFQTHIQLTNLFCANLVKLGLLEEVRADIALSSGEKHVLGGFLCVNREKLKKLSNEQLGELLNTDQLELIYTHLLSINNLDRLLKRLGAATKSPPASKLN